MMIACGGRDGVVWIWDLDVMSVAFTLNGHVMPVTALEWSQDDSYLLTAGLI